MKYVLVWALATAISYAVGMVIASFLSWEILTPFAHWQDRFWFIFCAFAMAAATLDECR